MVAGAVAVRVSAIFGERLVAVSSRIEDQRDRRAMPAQQGKVDAVGHGRGAQGQTTGRVLSAG